jgi:hypothetical protein
MGPFLIHLPKHITQLDFEALTSESKTILFNGIAYDAAEHLIIRLPVAVLPDPHFKGPARTRRQRSFEKVDQLFIQVNLPSDDHEILEVYPHTTLAPGLVDPQLELGISVEPTTGRFSLSGTLKNLIRRKRHFIINTHTETIAQWAFQKAYLQDNLQFNIDLLLQVNRKPDTPASLIVEAKAQDGGRLIRATRRKIMIEV